MSEIPSTTLPADTRSLLVEVRLDPPDQNATIALLCLLDPLVPFKPDQAALDSDTTSAVAIFDEDGSTLAAVPFLVTQPVGGSLERIEVQTWYDVEGSDLVASRDSFTLPNLEDAAAIAVLMETRQVELTSGGSTFALSDVQPCSGLGTSPTSE